MATERGILAPEIRLCPSQVACDGNTLFNERVICGSCERALERRRRRQTAALRGERHVTYTIARKK